jgi:hypothetical protein
LKRIVAKVHFCGSLNECSVEVQKYMIARPGVTFVIAKVLPVSTHTGSGFSPIPSAARNNVVQMFPERRQLAH